MKNVVKITSGKWRGRTIATPGGKTHPMGERERLALFNMISEYLLGAFVLDAYAGSGALGCEALSRGAEKVVFAESDARATRCISKNLAMLGLGCTKGKTATIEKTKVAQFQSEQGFNVILADPPYDSFVLADIQHLAQFLKDDGVFVLSHPGEAPCLQGLYLQKSRKYAGATISVYSKVE